MPTAGHNDSDTRAKLIDPALHVSGWLERVDESQRDSHGEIHREQRAVRIDILDGKPLKRGRGRVDYLLRAHVPGHDHPLTLAFVEAKKEAAPPTQGLLEQVKAYARRHAVKFVYSTNGHQFIEYDAVPRRRSCSSEVIPLVPTPVVLRDYLAFLLRSAFREGRECCASLSRRIADAARGHGRTAKAGVQHSIAS